MPNIRSAAKQMRQSIRRRAANRSERSAMRSSVKKIHTAIDNGDAQAANALLQETVSVIGKAAQKGLIHQNNASRHISRLTRRVHSMGSAEA